MSNFKVLSQAIVEQLNGMERLYTTNVTGDKMWETYLNSFPKGSNEIYRERTEHDCSCCKHFIRQVGNVVTIKDGKVVSIWDVDVPEPYKTVAKKMSKLIHSCELDTIFVTDIRKVGTQTSLEQEEDGNVKTWDHFHFEFEKKHVKRKDDIATIQGDYRTTKQMFNRLMEEITLDSVQTILEVIAQGSLYRGEEFKPQLQEFVKLKKKYEKAKKKDIWIWETNSDLSRLRNTAIGTVLIDLSSGVDLDVAVRKFEKVMAPANYKRPKAIFTAKMVKEAEKTINDLGYADSLGRRFASPEDITANNVLFLNRDDNKQPSVFEALANEGAKSLGRVEEIKIEDFVEKVLPTAKSLEVLMENHHEPNMVSLVAPKDSGPSMFKWGNNFSWAYNGDVTDGMKERVKAAGGKVDGVLRFSIQWNDNGKTNSDYDAHCVEPHGNEIMYSNKRSGTGGNLDVDITQPGGKVAVENITWPELRWMKTGDYRFFVHNYSKRGGYGGFSAEIEFNGEIYTFDYGQDLKSHERVEVATVRFDGNDFKIIKSLPNTKTTKEIWNVKTNIPTKVSMMMFSPNHWDEQNNGNKHYFFMLQGCKNPGTPRGFFNEFLDNDLVKHKRVFEALGNKMRVEPDDNQLSGIGFSSTQRNSLLMKVHGKTVRTLKVNF